MSTWRGLPLANPEDARELAHSHARAITQGAPSESAAQGLYTRYRKDAHEKAAAYHAKSAQILDHAGQKEQADKHREMFKMHLVHAGHNPRMGVPANVKAHLAGASTRELSFFEPHAADSLIGRQNG